MRTLIVLNGECKSIEFLQNLSKCFDKVICADGGYRHAVAANVNVDAVIGDFDSVECPNDIHCVVFPKEKDLSDAEIAIEYAAEKFGDDITVTCSLGNRLDHQMFNLFLLAKYTFLKIEEPDVLVYLCKSYEDFSNFEGNTISFLPIENANVTLMNFKYNAVGLDIQPGETVSLSNVALKEATIKVNSGRVITIINKTDM